MVKKEHTKGKEQMKMELKGKKHKGGVHIELKKAKHEKPKHEGKIKEEKFEIEKKKVEVVGKEKIKLEKLGEKAKSKFEKFDKVEVKKETEKGKFEKQEFGKKLDEQKIGKKTIEVGGKEKPKKERKKLSPEKAARRKIQERLKKKKLPTFRGRFGRRSSSRRITNEKWDKWRKPRGTDIKRRQQYGFWPETGYRTQKDIRFLHPSGMEEILVFNPEQLKTVGKNLALRISRTVGNKKRKQIIEEAEKSGFMILNK